MLYRSVTGIVADQLLDFLPIGVVVFPGLAFSDYLADKARKLGIPLCDFREGGSG